MLKVKPQQSGVALVLALWLLTLLGIMAAGYSYAMRTETRLAIHGVESAKARGIAEAGLWLAVAELLKPELKRQWLTDGTPYQVRFGEGQIHLRIQDEAGKIDLNTAGDALLRGLLERAAQPGDDVTYMLNAILDWRDRDRLPRTPGAEDSDYEHAGHGAKDGLFNSIEELSSVAGMTHEIYTTIFPALTVHSLQGGIHPMVAPREVLSALPGSNVELVDAFLSSRRNGDEIVALPAGMDERYFSGARGTAFTITSEGAVGGSRVKLDMVITLNNGSRPPYSVLSWRESKPAYNAPQAANASQEILAYGR